MRTTSPILYWRLQQGSRCTRWLIILLCIATWRGPIPLVHAHGSEKGADRSLAAHLHNFHQGHLKQSYFGLHLHLLLPWERFSPTDGDQKQIPDPLTHEGVVISAPVTNQLITSLCDANPETSFCDQQLMISIWSRQLATLGLHVPAFNSFIESQLLAAPLCAVTGVSLC